MALPHLSSKAIVVLDDIYWSEGITRTWKEIIARPEVSLSIDWYKLGLVLLDPAIEEKGSYPVWC